VDDVDEVEGYLNKAGTVTLDGSGNGTLDFDVDHAWQRWEIAQIVVSTNQPSNQAPYPTAEVFAGPIAPVYSQGATWTGNQDTFSGKVDLDAGTELHVVWTGGLPGSIATARIHGKKYSRTS
jgi:hypothetical protein